MLIRMPCTLYMANFFVVVVDYNFFFHKLKANCGSYLIPQMMVFSSSRKRPLAHVKHQPFATAVCPLL